MKYMIMMFGGAGRDAGRQRSPDWITGMGELMMTLARRDGGGRRAGGRPRAGRPEQAKTVRFEGGAPVSTDGPFAEIKESLAGYWVIDATEERALEIASRAVAYIEYPMEVRRVMHESVPA